MIGWLWIVVGFLLALPGFAMELGGWHFTGENSALEALVLGLAVVGAAFLLSWACEVAQKDIPPALALSVLALIAVLPEYAVSFALTSQAAHDPRYLEFTVANMTGANRMIVGFAWPLIIFIFWWRFRQRRVKLEISQRVEVGFLLWAGLYSLIIPVKGQVDLLDFGVLILLYVIYTWRISKAEVHEPELMGPAANLGQLSQAKRRIFIVVMLVYAAAAIFVVAHPFAEALIHTGTQLGINEVFMVQWFAPLASEAPEIIVTVLFTLKGLASAGLGALVASKVNQWTLLLGTMPLVFSFSAGSLQPLPLTPSQIGSMFVTSGQTLLAVMILINLSASLWGAGVLLGLLIAQFIFHDTDFLFGCIYLSLAAVLVVRHYKEFKPTLISMFNFRGPKKEEKLVKL